MLSFDPTLTFLTLKVKYFHLNIMQNNRVGFHRKSLPYFVVNTQLDLCFVLYKKYLKIWLWLRPIIFLSSLSQNVNYFLSTHYQHLLGSLQIFSLKFMIHCIWFTGYMFFYLHLTQLLYIGTFCIIVGLELWGIV